MTFFLSKQMRAPDGVIVTLQLQAVPLYMIGLCTQHAYSTYISSARARSRFVDHTRMMSTRSRVERRVNIFAALNA